jgi:hypothetical protein
LVYADTISGLQVRCVLIEYHDFPTVEWTLYFKNTGHTDTPIIEKIQPFNVELSLTTSGEFLLHHNVGSPANGNDYGLLQTMLGPKTTKRLAGAGGRPTNADWSYFNLEWSNEGLIVAVGCVKLPRTTMAISIHSRPGRVTTQYGWPGNSTAQRRARAWSMSSDGTTASMSPHVSGCSVWM